MGAVKNYYHDEICAMADNYWGVEPTEEEMEAHQKECEEYDALKKEKDNART